MGDDAYTQGRAHPMIDPGLRLQRIAREAADPATAVLLLDVILGFGAQEDPASVLIDALEEARQCAARDGRYLCVIASVCGTESDAQVLSQQEQRLRDAGVLVASSNAEASRLAAAVIKAIR